MKIRQYAPSGYGSTELSFNIFVDKQNKTYYHMSYKRPERSTWDGVNLKLTKTVMFIWSME